MTARHFPNRLQDFAPGSTVSVNREFWRQEILQYMSDITESMPATIKNCDGSLYVGCAGVAYMFQYAAKSTVFRDIKDDLVIRAVNYADVSLSHTASKRNKDPAPALLLGNAGVFLMASFVYELSGKQLEVKELAQKYTALAGGCTSVDYLGCGSDELFVGRAGYLLGTLYLKRELNIVVPERAVHAVWSAVLESGRQRARRYGGQPPLMFSYYDTEYLGAAHGVSAILQVMLQFPGFVRADAAAERDLRGTVDWLLGLQQADGNLAPALDEIQAGERRSERNELVHWCHGGPGIVYLFAKAWLFWRDDKYLNACLKCGELTWQKGLLRKGPGICHGVAGSGYVFLLLHRLTRDERHLHRALQFAQFIMTSEFRQGARKPDNPYSLYEGVAGTVCFLTDLLQPQQAEFPLFDIFVDF